MKHKYLVGGCAVSIMLAWLAWPTVKQDGAAQTAKTGSTLVAAPGPGAIPPMATKAGELAPPSDGIDRVPLLPLDQSASATLSLAEGHLRGDPRTPPLVRANDNPLAASDAELADPKAYAAYETRQNLRVLAQFNQAAAQMLPQLRQDIERGRQLGIAPEKIAKAEEKYRRIAAEQANILKQHPELAQASARQP
jgi:hypothetical protein